MVDTLTFMSKRAFPLWIPIATCTLALLYVVSFGPVFYVANKIDKHLAHEGFFTFYFPHYCACYHSKGYFSYIQWCGGMRRLTHEEFRTVLRDEFGDHNRIEK